MSVYGGTIHRVTPEEKHVYDQAYYAANKERILARNREWMNAHAEDQAAKHREYKRGWMERNHEQVIAVKRAWRARPDVKARELEQAREGRIRRKHGLTLDQIEEMLAAQGGRCYLCDGELLMAEPGQGRGSGPVIEHDHRCCPRLHSCVTCRRGLACHPCNKAAGLVGDDPARLRRMADALEAAAQSVTDRLAARDALNTEGAD